MDISRILRRRVGIGRNLILVGFSGIPRLVESGRFLGYKVDSYGNFKLVDPGRFFRF